MKTLAAIKRRMLPGARLLCVENTYRPALNGSLRTVVRSGPGAWRFRLDGDDKVSVGFWPKASEVQIIDADTFSLGFEMGDKAQRVLGFQPKWTDVVDVVAHSWKWLSAHPKGYADAKSPRAV